jgi:hypothetical protein
VPALARRIRERLEAEFDESFADWLALLGELRPMVRAAVPDEEQRRRLWEELTRWEWLERVRREGVEAVRQALRGVIEQAGSLLPQRRESDMMEESSESPDIGLCVRKEASMSENKPTTAAEPGPEPERDPVMEDEILQEWVWLMHERSQGLFDEYAGRHVAVVNRTVLGSSLDPDLLRQYLAEKHHIDPRRIVTFYVEGW